MNVETWLPIPAYEDLYAVSSLGRVQRTGGGKGATAGRIVAPKIATNGYRHVDLSRGDCKVRFGIHRLVALAFLGPSPFEGAMVNHKDGDKTNNIPENLEWVDRIGNARHAVSIGRGGGKALPGESNGRAKLTIDQVAEIRSLKGRIGQREIARRFGVARTTIQWIHQGKHWT